MSSGEQTALTIVGAGIGFVASGFNPMGAMYGAQIGYGIGASTLSTTLPGQEGPRLNDLQSTTSEYGQPLGKAYGTMKRGGIVIWSSPIEETKTTQQQEQGGKGAPSTKTSYTTYSYSVSFAVAFNDGEVSGVRRIWLNDILAYDAGDISDYGSLTDTQTADWLVTKSRLLGGDGQVTIYPGSDTQEPDPTIESYEGAGNVPAFRDTAYIVFENLQLEKYGNRRPQVFIEYVSVSGSVSVDSALIKTIDISGILTGSTFNDTLFCVEKDLTMHFYTGDWTSSYTTTNGDYYVIFPTGAVTFKNKYSHGLRLGSGYAPVKSHSNIPALFGINFNGSQDGIALHLPEGSLLGGGLTSFDVPAGTFLSGTNYGDQTISLWGTNKSGHILLYKPLSDTVRVIPYTNTIEVSLLGNARSVLEFNWWEFDLGFSNPTKCAVISENYIYSCDNAGNFRKHDHNGNLLQSWSSGTALSDQGEGISVDQSDENIVFVRDGEQLYKADFESETLTAYSVAVGSNRFDAQVPYASNKIITVWDETAIKIYSVDTISKTGEALASVVTSLCEQSGLSASDIDVTALSGITVDGFMFAGGTAGKAIESLMTAFQFSCYEDEGKLNFRLRSGSTDKTISSDDMETQAA